MTKDEIQERLEKAINNSGRAIWEYSESLGDAVIVGEETFNAERAARNLAAEVAAILAEQQAQIEALKAAIHPAAMEKAKTDYMFGLRRKYDLTVPPCPYCDTGHNRLCQEHARLRGG